MLYPLKFVPIQKERIWGGHKLHTFLNKPSCDFPVGESWELSAISGDESVVSNGELVGKTLTELIGLYKGDLVGEKVYKKYGSNFPLLFKFIDAHDDLSIQVHPDDKTAQERHACFGKTEFWYVVAAEEGAELVIGFNQKVNQEIYLKHLNAGTLDVILKKVPVKKGDAFFIPAGLVHAIGKGVLLAEIQQSSDVTYRLYDYNRKDSNGNGRQLHTEEALDVIDFNSEIKSKIDYPQLENNIIELVSCQYFTVNVIAITQTIHRDIEKLSSSVAYICVAGTGVFVKGNLKSEIKKGDLFLIPSVGFPLEIQVRDQITVLEIHI